MIKNLKTFYLVLAFVGAVVLYYCFWRFLRSEGIGVMPLIEGVDKRRGRRLNLDVVISSLVFWAFMLSQKEKGPAPLRFIVLNRLWARMCYRVAVVITPAAARGLLKARRLSSAGFDKLADRPGFHARSRDFLQREFLKIYRERFAIPLP